jgi:(Z)-2-((N-methylformamido)methylene)-5-hydroxybutyrolactone dehydrogenase
MRRLADLIAAEADRLAEIETRDNGKLITEMRTQLRYIPQWFHYFGGLADKIEGRVIPIDKRGMVNFTREEPFGVVAAITPWNSPLMLATWKLAPALSAGNTIVWKPSEFSSVSALEFGHLFEKAGFPPGVVNILTGFGSEIGDRLVSHPQVAKIAFTAAIAPDRASMNLPRARSSQSRSNWAASRPISSSRTPRSRTPSREWSPASSRRPARLASRAPGR